MRERQKQTKPRRNHDNLPTLKKAKILSNNNLLVGYQSNENLAVSGTSFTPKHSQPGFGRI